MLMTLLVNFFLWTVTMSLPALAMLLFYADCMRVARQEAQDQDVEKVQADLEKLAAAPHLVEWKFKRSQWALREANWLLVRKTKQ